MSVQNNMLFLTGYDAWAANLGMQPGGELGSLNVDPLDSRLLEGPWYTFWASAFGKYRAYTTEQTPDCAELRGVYRHSGIEADYTLCEFADGLCNELANRGYSMVALSCYGEKLRNAYEQCGFIVHSKHEFVLDYAPDGWNVAVHGKPTVYWMVRNIAESGESGGKVWSRIKKWWNTLQERVSSSWAEQEQRPIPQFD